MALPELHAERLLQSLAQGGVDFVVVGGIAVIAHGHVRATKDVDIVYAGDDANLERLGDVLLALEARLRGIEENVPFVPDGRTLRRTRILTLEPTEGGIDLLVEPSGAPSYERLRASAERADFDGVTILIAGLDDLIAMKRAAGRPQDLIDLEALEAIRRIRRSHVTP